MANTKIRSAQTTSPELDWVDYSATSTITGWSSFTTKTIHYKKLGKLVFVYFNLVGTSNSTTTKFTVPSTMVNTPTYGTCFAVDNGGAKGLGMVYTYGNTNELTFWVGSGGNFTGSGTKSVQGHFVYVEA